MTLRTSSKTITFHRLFWPKGVDRLLPPADYRVVTDEELIEGLSFPAYRRVATMIFVPRQSGSSLEVVTIDPLDLQAAQDQDLGTLSMRHQMALRQEERDECRDHSEVQRERRVS
jgi:hypothetical protein